MKLAEDVVQVLKPLKTVTTLMSTEQIPTISMILPLKHRILASMKHSGSDSTVVKDIKAAIAHDFEDRYPDTDRALIQFLHMSTALRGAVRGGGVRTILRALDGRGPPDARALHFSPTPTRLRSGQFSHHNSDIHQLVMNKIAALVETTGDRAAAAVKSGSTVFSVQQQQRAVSAAEEFCFKYTQ